MTSTELVEVRVGEIAAGPLNRMSPAEVTEWAHWVREVAAAALTQDVDYGIIPGTQKPSLWKSGAELLLVAAGLGSTVERGAVDVDVDGRRLGVYYKATVHRGATVVAECEAYAGFDENRFFVSAEDNTARERVFAEKDKRPVRADRCVEYRAPWNSVVKMCQKRAIVGAALIATATSGLFTQDIEDEAPAAAAAVEAPAWQRLGFQSAEDEVSVNEGLLARMKEVPADRAADVGAAFDDLGHPKGHRFPVSRDHADALGPVIEAAIRGADAETGEVGPSEPEPPAAAAEEADEFGPGGLKTSLEAEAEQTTFDEAQAAYRPTEDVPVGDVLAEPAVQAGPSAPEWPDNGHRSQIDGVFAKSGVDGLIAKVRSTPSGAVVKQLQSRGVTVSTEWDEDTCRRLLGAIVVRNAEHVSAEDPDEESPF